MSQPRNPRYRTTNWKQYNAALRARGSLTVWLDKRVSWFAATSGKRGRSPKFSDAAIQFCLTLKNLFGLALIYKRGPCKTHESLELATLQWVHWFNHVRLLESIGHIPPGRGGSGFLNK